MKIRPLHDRVIVKRLEEEKTSPGGNPDSDTAAEKPGYRERYVAVGKGKNSRRRPGFRALDVKIGDKILFGKVTGGTEVKVVTGRRFRWSSA